MLLKKTVAITTSLFPFCSFSDPLAKIAEDWNGAETVIDCIMRSYGDTCTCCLAIGDPSLINPVIMKLWTDFHVFR